MMCMCMHTSISVGRLVNRPNIGVSGMENLIRSTTCFPIVLLDCIVLYAPLTSSKLNMKRKCTRPVVWSKERNLPVPLMDVRYIFYPETCGYGVCTLSDGMDCVRVCWYMLPSIRFSHRR